MAVQNTVGNLPTFDQPENAQTGHAVCLWKNLHLQ